MAKFTLDQINEVENRLDAIKDAIADLQSAISGLDNMCLTNSFGLTEWSEALDEAVGELQSDLEEVMDVELGE